jgi:hypothetical protein
MKTFSFFLFLFFLFSCNQQNDETKKLAARIDSLQQALADTYKPGFGEFMSNIQVHHAKLWFAGKNKNWDLADFEIHEIMENIDGIKQYQAERPETKSLLILNPALDTMNAAIQQKDPVRFRNAFILLTNTCNDCHKSVNYSFNEVKIPDSPPFSNQSFQPVK